MSDFDKNDIVNDDFDANDIHESTHAKPQVSQLESAARGVEQGATLGFGDEIRGGMSASMDAGQALLNKLGLASPSPSQVDSELDDRGFQGDLKPSILAQYQQMRDQARNDNQIAQESNPGTYLAGNVAGGALTIPMAPGIMAPAAEGAGMLARAGTAAINAAPISAAMGAGMSQADLTQGDIMPAISDISKDTALGMGAAGALPIIGGGIKAGGNAIANTQIGQDMGEALNVGLQGLNMKAPDFLIKGRDKLKDIAGSADDSIRGKLSSIFKEKGQVLNKLEESGAQADIKNTLQTLADKVNGTNALRDEELKVINKVLENQFSKKGNIRTAKELENLLKDLQDLKGNVQTGSGYKAINEAVDHIKSIQNEMAPELQNLNNQAFQVAEAGELLTKRNPLDYLGAKADQNVREQLANTLENSGSYKTDSFLNDIINKGTQTSKNANVGALKDLVPDASKALQQAKPIANQMRIANEMKAPIFSGDNMFSSAMNAIKTGGTTAANKTGLAVNASKDFLANGVETLSKADGNQIQQLANKMIQVGGKAAEPFVRVLNESTNKSSTARNAIMFGLMQQPEFRELYHKTNGTEPK